MITQYDENEILGRLTELTRERKTIFALSCAEWLTPFYEEYAIINGTQSNLLEARRLLRWLWSVVRHEESLPNAIESRDYSFIPDEDLKWSLSTGFAENAAAALVYAERTWQADSAQDATWAARQAFEAADLAMVRAAETSESRTSTAPPSADYLIESALSMIALNLTRVEHELDVNELESITAAEGQRSVLVQFALTSLDLRGD